ncbi:hypothetical protein QF035_010332 [Streptomyces umbrinus]|uniref:Uncharacterized protein n=1 Tax=Streptomyces umbrinus TaxID=67370 RepID=A0ABU0TAB2_9ACTN|nr:hypothetical protein [Streptomyces umbrinus]
MTAGRDRRHIVDTGTDSFRFEKTQEKHRKKP